MNLHSVKTDEENTSGSNEDAMSLLKPTQPLHQTQPDGFVSTAKFTVTRVLEEVDAINGDTMSDSDLPTSESEQSPLLANGSATTTTTTKAHLDPPHSLGPTGPQNVSSDSGFESIEKMPLVSNEDINDDSLTEESLTAQKEADEEATDILRALRNEEVRLNNNNDDNDASKDGNDTNEQDDVTGSCDTKRKTTNTKAKKNRTTTVNTTMDEPVLEPMVINKNDGLQDVLYYIDENGSPKIREKYSKKSRVKKEREQKKKLTYGTEADIADPFVFDEKTPSCVSFSRLCKRFKNTFSKCVSTSFCLCLIICQWPRLGCETGAVRGYLLCRVGAVFVCETI